MASKLRYWAKDPDMYCYICDKYISKENRLLIRRRYGGAMGAIAPLMYDNEVFQPI